MVGAMWPGVAIAAVSIFVVGGGLLVLTHEDAVRTCNAKWELSISEANLKREKDVGDANERIRVLEQSLVKVIEERNALQVDQVKILEKQREATPLSEDCTRCRVPWGRVWVRRGSKGGPGGAELRQGGS